MLLNAKVLKVEIKKNPAFHEITGEPHPSYFLEATVLDIDTYEKYQCSFRDVLGAERLLKAYKDNLPEAERNAIAADVEANAKHDIEHQEVAMTVVDVDKFGTLVVEKVQAVTSLRERPEE